jgi:hypothetical protein
MSGDAFPHINQFKPAPGMHWLMFGLRSPFVHFVVIFGSPAQCRAEDSIAERLLFECQSSCDQVGRLCRAENWHMLVIEVRFKLEKETKGALRYQEVDEKGEVIEQAWAKIGTLYVRKSAFERGAAFPQLLRVSVETAGP